MFSQFFGVNFLHIQKPDFVMSCNHSYRTLLQCVFVCVRCSQKCLFSHEEKTLKKEAVWSDDMTADVPDLHVTVVGKMFNQLCGAMILS